MCGPFHVVTTGKKCRLREVKIAFADAAVERKPLVVCAQGGYTGDAIGFAHRASVALYEIDSQSLRIYPANALAKEHVPHMI